MATKLQMSGSDRQFWELIARAAFSNPFSEERSALDREIIGQTTDPGTEGHLPLLTATVSERVQRLEAEGRADVRLYAEEDRGTMLTVFLFEVFHRYCLAFDDLVREQARRGESSIPVPFAGEALALLRRRGFDERESVRFFAIFYQLRRAYHFIVRGLIGQSPCMRELRRHLWNNVFTGDVRLYDRFFWNRMEDFSTLLLGETGTGKGTAAAAIGRSGFIPFDERQERFAESFTRTFVSLNLSQFPETLIESELFGHRKGAFTGAVEAHEGLLARCRPNGAIFLDEIGDVSVPVQIKLLQVLQERTFCPVGSHVPSRFHGRVIAATNRSLDALRRQGLFRDDFFYRLCSDVIVVPPLRQRLREDPAELNRLLGHVLLELAGPEAPELIERVQETLERELGLHHEWPGNVRELEQVVRRVLLTGRCSVPTESSAPEGPPNWLRDVEAGTLDADALMAGYCARLHRSLGSYEAVAQRTNLDRRTARKYVLAGSSRSS